MSIIQKDKSLKDKLLPKDKHLPSGDNSPLKDRLLPKGETQMPFSFFPRKKQKKILINPNVILSDMEKGYLAFSEFIYNNPNGK